MTELPGSWSIATLDDVCIYIQRGKSPKYVERSSLPVVNQKCVRWRGLERQHFKFIDPAQWSTWAEERFLRRHDVLWNSTGTGTIGRACLYVPESEHERLVVDSHITILRAVGGIEGKYLFYFVMSPIVQKRIADMQAGSTNQVELPKSEICETRIPIAPVSEQKRIISKIDELFSRLEDGERALEKVRMLVERYGQSVLKAAVTGELTRDWREKNRGKFETGEALLARILKARREAWERAELDKIKAKGVTPANGRWRQKYDEPTPPNATGLPDLTEGWTWASIDQVSAETLIGLDRGASEQSADRSGCPYVKMNNVTMRGHVLFDDLVFVKATSDEHRKFLLRDGDILFNTRNSKELVGKTGLVVNPPPATLYNNNLMRLRVVPGIDPRFLVAQMCEPKFRSRMESIKKATTSVAAVYAKDLLPLAVAIPPLGEQSAISSEVERLISLADQLVSEVIGQVSAAKGMRQAILMSAFSGTLLPQDPTDEPAHLLLDRIAAEQATHAESKRGPKSKSTESA